MLKKVLESMVFLEQLLVMNFHHLLIFVINSVWEKFQKIQHLNHVNINATHTV